VNHFIHRLLSTKTKTAKRTRRRTFGYVEPLENRLVLSALSFVPIAHVAVNPQPLPPLAQVEFIPIGFPALDASSKDAARLTLKGAFEHSALVSVGTHPPQPCIVDAIYSLSGSVTPNLIPPGPSQAGTFSASFSLTGTVGVLIAFESGSPSAPIWVFSGTVREQGTESGTITSPTAAANSQLTGQWQFTEVTLERGVSSNAPFSSWFSQVQTGSTGTFVETFIPPGPQQMPTASMTFAQQDQFMQTLIPPGPTNIPPGPATFVDGTFNASGTMTDTVLAAQTATMPEVDTGTVQFTDQLTETIIPPGPQQSPQTLMQNAQVTGSFANVEVDGGTGF
jgi:hypothetical protein